MTHSGYKMSIQTILLLLLGIAVLPKSSRAQVSTSPATFNEASYHEVSRGIDPDNSFYQFVVFYKSSADTSYSLKTVYEDSSYTKLMVRTFYKNSVPEGPYSIYANGKVQLQVNYKDGLYDGEIISYIGDQLVKKGFFTKGIKTGLWEEYDLAGKLVRKTTYDSSGKLTSDTKY